MANDMLIADVPEEGLGPAMQKCTPKQRKFVIACLTIGSGHWQRAAAMAGYSGSNEVLRVTGFRTAQLQHVRAAILEMAASNLAAHTIVAQATVLDIMTDERADKKTRLRAAEMVMDRTGLHSKTEHNVNVTHELGDRASMVALLQAKVKQNPGMFDKLPEPVQKLLAAPQPKVIEDAEFTEVIDWEAVNVGPNSV